MSTRETRIGGIAAVIALTVISMSNHLGSRSPKAEAYSVVPGAGPIRSARLRDGFGHWRDVEATIDSIAAMEINPLIVHAVGQGVSGVDLLIEPT